MTEVMISAIEQIMIGEVPIYLANSPVLVRQNAFQRNICAGEDIYDIDDQYQIWILGDGHSGKEVSMALKKHMKKTILSCLSETDGTHESVVRAIKKAYREVDRLAMHCSYASSRCGSTCIVAFVYGETLYVSNLGDSPAVLFEDGTQVLETRTHTYMNPDEKSRIDALIDTKMTSVHRGYNLHVLDEDHITNIRSDLVRFAYGNFEQCIVPTENLGHLNWKMKSVMTGLPYIESYRLKPGYKYELFMCSDGVSDMLTHVGQMRNIASFGEESRTIVEHAERKWRQKWIHRDARTGIDTPNQFINDVDDMTAIYVELEISS